ncbi:hypothetical protein M8C21_000261 [Ambrosia artemisiifolia]|uniref:AUGMIN subunit 5 n=1 Tax=Ambrosia artemisiifolia TaxID=4212 RepID=A0AAD5GR28_AMBAR|nr:hypothetical protein M8C21_000261 [Ambrosia artemisiifolia]
MQSSPDAILDWLQKEMGYRPLGPYIASTKASMPSPDAIRRVCRGNMIPIWNFLIKRVKSEKTVEGIRRNIMVHGEKDNVGGEVGRRVGRKREKAGSGSGLGDVGNREVALQEREVAEKEVERLRHMVRRKRKELKARMLEVSREEAERKRMMDERSNYRHKQVMLDAYDQQCDEAARIFSEYHKRLRSYVNQVKDAQRGDKESSNEVVTSFQMDNEKGDVYSTVKGSKPADDVILIETSRERNIRKACESLALHMIERIQNSFPAYEGIGIHSNPQIEAGRLGVDVDGDLPDDVRDVIRDCLKSPNQLLFAITTYTQRLKSLVSKEIEKIDVRADADMLRYKYENNRVMHDSSPDVNSPLPFQLYGNGKSGMDMPSRGTQNQLLERQKAHVQQFIATEDELNKAAEARTTCQKLLKRLYGSVDFDPSHPLAVGGTSQTMSSLRQLELDVWTKEREAAGLKASLTTLISEDAAAFWRQQPLAAREYASTTIIPACNVLIDISNKAKDLIDKEVSAFYRSPDNSLYMLPSTPQALLESMGPSGSTGLDAVAAAEKSATLLTARAGARDPSAIPSICRVSAALQYPAGLEGSDAGTTSYCLELASEQEKTINEDWLPELRNGVVNAQKSLDDCKYVTGLLEEWWEQPASTVVDWVTVDGQNVSAWNNHVKQLLAFYDKELL